MYEPRIYRNEMGKERFKTFTVEFLVTDLWIAVDKGSYSSLIPEFVAEKVIELRKDLDNFIKEHSIFKSSLKSIDFPKDVHIPEVACEMIKASSKTGIGPMSAVAGAFSFFVGQAIENNFNVKELIIENGGDLYLNIIEDTVIKIYAGNSIFSNKIGIKIRSSHSPLGVCTSAGAVGHSLNFGRSDAVMIACKNPLLADSYATAISNKLNDISDMDEVLQQIKLEKEIISSLIIIDNKLGITGDFELIV